MEAFGAQSGFRQVNVVERVATESHTVGRHFLYLRPAHKTILPYTIGDNIKNRLRAKLLQNGKRLRVGFGIAVIDSDNSRLGGKSSGTQSLRLFRSLLSSVSHSA